MACPFSLKCRIDSKENEASAGPIQQTCPGSEERRRKDSENHLRGWDRGPSLDSSGGSSLGVVLAQNNVVTSPGMVQQRVNSYIHMTRSTSTPVTGGSMVTSGKRRHRVSLNEDDKPLFVTVKDPPDPDEPLSLNSLTEAVWSFITIPVSIRYFIL